MDPEDPQDEVVISTPSPSAVELTPLRRKKRLVATSAAFKQVRHAQQMCSFTVHLVVPCDRDWLADIVCNDVLLHSYLALCPPPLRVLQPPRSASGSLRSRLARIGVHACDHEIGSKISWLASCYGAHDLLHAGRLLAVLQQDRSPG